MDMISRRKRLDGSEPRTLEPPCKDDMPIHPIPTRRQLSERHPDLEGDTGLLRQDPHWTNFDYYADKGVEDRANVGWLSIEMVAESVLCARVRLVPIGELSTATRAGPQGPWAGISHALRRRRKTRHSAL